MLCLGREQRGLQDGQAGQGVCCVGQGFAGFRLDYGKGNVGLGWRFQFG